MTALTDAIYDAYAYDESDTAKFTRQLTERRRATWINTLSELASKHGCNRLAGTPKGADAKKLADDSKADAESITNTYNNDLRRAIEKLYEQNRRGNQQYYISNLKKWQTKRDTWKVYQIALATDTTTRQYAFSRFYAENSALNRSYVATGPPATCKICIKLFAAGVVSYEFTQMNPFPAHINCPHSWKSAAPIKAVCDSLWLG